LNERKKKQLLIGNHPTEEAVFAERHFLQLSGKRDAAEVSKGTTNYTHGAQHSYVT
jgi:hypothetical protein